MRYRQSLLLLVVAAVAASGCSKSNPYEIVPVTGTVKFKDGSIPKAMIRSITFVPDDPAKAPRPPSGDVKDDGSFSLTTENPDDGAIIGSALIRRIAQAANANKPPPAIIAEVEQFLSELMSGVPKPPPR